MTCISYSLDGQFIATGGMDGKIKIWNTLSGFCFVTFADHSTAVTCVEFARKKQVVFSCSLDGTVRAYDLIRYRNFKTFTSPTPEQFSSLTVDQSGDIVVAGSQDSFEIYMWSVQTGQLLDIISGHEGPISCLQFSPTTGQLASGSWDKTVRFWDVYARDKSAESFEHQSEVLALAFSPDGTTLVSTTMNGTINFWDVNNGKMISEIEAKRDIEKGRKASDLTVAKNASDKHFTSVCFTADGSGIICGGNFKYVCIYDTASRLLLKRFQITKNQSLDGMNSILNSKNMTEAGAMDLIDQTGELSDLEDRLDKSLPGVAKGDPSLRKTRPEARTMCVKFSPNGRSWAAASTEGLLIYSLDSSLFFDPFDLELNINPESILKTLESKDYLLSFVMAFRLGEQPLIEHVYHRIPFNEIQLVMAQLPSKYIDKLLALLSSQLESNHRIQFHLEFTRHLFRFHGQHIRLYNLEYMSSLTFLRKALKKPFNDLSQV